MIENNQERYAEAALQKLIMEHDALRAKSYQGILGVNPNQLQPTEGYAAQQRQPEMVTVVEALVTGIQKLEKLIESLEHKMGPVLRPEPPAVKEQNTVGRSYMTAFASGLNDLYMQLDRHNKRVESMLDRLEF